MEKKTNKLEEKLVVAIVERASWRFVDHVKTLTNSRVILTFFFFFFLFNQNSEMQDSSGPTHCHLQYFKPFFYL